MMIKRVLRPLIPDRLMARYRLAQHSRQVRVNVDVVITDPKRRKRWLGTTPDTYRVVPPPSSDAAQPPQSDVRTFGADTVRAIELLSLPDVDVGVVARIAAPAIVGRRRVEPPAEPVAIAASSDVIAEIGGPPGGPEPLPGLLARLRDAGRRLAVLPVETDMVDAERNDPIDEKPVVILAAVPLHDIGGGSRAAQLAFALLRAGFHVTYVALHGTQESSDLGLRYIHPNLEQYRADSFDSGRTADRSASQGLVIVEVPASTYRDPIEVLSRRGWTVGYDIIDDWSDPALGGEWYDADTERWMIGRVDFVTASAPDLVERARVAGSSATLIPNAVNRDLFGPVAADRPADMPETDGPILGYCGSLYGDWFDWEALRSVAEAFPGGKVVMIGDARGIDRDMPANVTFLGLKAQGDLPAYVQRFDVGLLPFHVTETTHAVSPLKVYEYLASGVPVAAPPLRALDSIDGVHTDRDLVSAVQAAIDAAPPDRHAVLEQHSWDARVDTLIGCARLDRPAVPGDPVLIRKRPVVHYTRGARDVRGGTGRLAGP
jgi:glycosyltransferase involved in cell wall biosynthesis